MKTPIQTAVVVLALLNAFQSNPATVTVDPTFTKVTAGDIVTDQEGSGTDYDNDGAPWIGFRVVLAPGQP
jgi:hypothetical protein